MLFMKGTPDMPRCGFSARISQILNASGAEYAAMDILPDPRIREELSGLSGWPTIPQLFVGGELVGGCDIVTEMFESGELAETLGTEQPQAAAQPPAGPCSAGAAPADRVGPWSRRARPGCRATNATTRSSRRTPRCRGWASAWSGSARRSRRSRSPSRRGAFERLESAHGGGYPGPPCRGSGAGADGRGHAARGPRHRAARPAPGVWSTSPRSGTAPRCTCAGSSTSSASSGGTSPRPASPAASRFKSSSQFAVAVPVLVAERVHPSTNARPTANCRLRTTGSACAT